MAKVGKPAKYDVDTLSNKIEEYFNVTKEEEITITGLCLYLGINKDTFYEYNKKDNYKQVVEMARLRVESSYELSLRKYGRTGDIFALKNFGWKDKTEVENTGEQSLNVNIKVMDNGS